MKTMKKINILLATLAMLVATVSCNNDDKLFNEPSSANGDLKIDITVADLQSSTKAIKTGWANGDIINVYLDDAVSNYVPDFTLTFNGTNWVASEISDAVKNRLKANNGKLSGFWEGSNSCMTDASWSKNGGYIDFPGYGSATGHKGNVVADFQEIPYTISEGILSANISSWRFRSDLQIVVSGISFEDGRYTLCSDGINNLSSIGVHTYAVEHQCYVSYYGTGYEYGRVAGIANADGVAFVGALSTTYSAGENFKVYLIDNVTGVTYSFTKVLTESLGSDNSKVIGIKIPFNKFAVDLTKTPYFTSYQDGSKLVFSKGNLQYIGSADTPYWMFANNQWNCLGNNGQGTSATNKDRDLFGWGTSGYNHGAVYYQPWNINGSPSDFYPYGGSNNHLNSGSGKADWGYNPIKNGGDTENLGWCTPSRENFVYILGPSSDPVPGTNCRTSATVGGVENARFAKAYLFGSNHGLILFPDNYVHPNGVDAPTGINATDATSWNANQYSAADWAKMEAAGAVFLPAAGYRMPGVANVNINGAYWSNQNCIDSKANCLTFDEGTMKPDAYYNKQAGCAVRLVYKLK